MALSSQLEILVEESRQALATDASGNLTLPHRRRIWRTAGLVVKQRTVHGEGLKRRAQLARLCAERVLPIWQQAFPADDGPQRMLNAAAQYLNGRMSWDSAYEVKNNLWTQLEDKLNAGEHLDAVYAGFSAANAVNTALNDENLGTPQNASTQLDDDLDPFDWDASFFGAVAFAGGASWEPQSSIERRRAFWQWYLDEAVPQALGT